MSGKAAAVAHAGASGYGRAGGRVARITRPKCARGAIGSRASARQTGCGPTWPGSASQIGGFGVVVTRLWVIVYTLGHGKKRCRRNRAGLDHPKHRIPQA
jgi:hypothetical protein